MHLLALALFVLAALGGIALVAIRLRDGANPPYAIAVVHGVAAAAGLAIAVVVAMAPGEGRMALTGVGVLAAAALGGAWLFVSHSRGRLIPVSVSVIHAALAIVGVGLFALAVLAGQA